MPRGVREDCRSGDADPDVSGALRRSAWSARRAATATRAFEAFQKAHRRLEQLRSHLQGDDLKVAFLEDKQAVYESLVSICLALGPTRGHLEAAFGYIEKAKSRSLADLIAFRAGSLAPRVAGKATDAVPRLRQELNWHYRQVELEEIGREKRSARADGRACDSGRARSRNSWADRSTSSAGRMRSSPRSRAAPRSASRRFARAWRRTRSCSSITRPAGRSTCACSDAISSTSCPSGRSREVRNLLRLLQFQLSKFRLGPDYVGAFAEQLQAATEAHLRELHAALIAPIRDRLHAAHLVVVPHDVLHFLPFHALFDGERFLIDEFTVSYAPSASVYRLCRTKPARSSGGALIMGVPDASTPFIVDEVRAVASVLPDAQVFLGARRDRRSIADATARTAGSCTSRRTACSVATTRCSRRSGSATVR